MLRMWTFASVALGFLSAFLTASAQEPTAPPPAAAYAPPQLPPRNETPEARRTRWEAWRAANADINARIAIFLRDTEAQVAAYRNRPVVDRFAAMRDGVTAARRREALTYFSSAFGVWQSEDFAAAEIGFRRGLEIDPTNAPANFYMGDLLRRRGDSSGARDYFERSVAFGAGSAEALRAEAALAQLPAGGDPTINEPPAIWDAASRPSLVWDAPDAPEMVVIPAGAYTMGSPSSESDRDSDEGPQHRVTLARPFAVSRFEVTRGQYGAFALTTGRTAGGNCFTDRDNNGSWEQDPNGTWRDPGFTQGEDHPVVCVSWEDAQAYVQWLNTQTRGGYRLLSEAEWEYVARAGTTSPFVWGSDQNGGCAYANGADATARARFPSWTTSTCNDGTLNTAAVGAYQRNAFGLHDMIGNVWEWTQDCYEGSLDSVPTNGSANETNACSSRVFRGGSWYCNPQYLRSANRDWYSPSYRDSGLGFRVARTL